MSRNLLRSVADFKIEIPVTDIVDQMTTGAVNREELIEFIKDIDQEMHDWDFTLALCDHFSALKLEWEREVAAKKVQP